MLHSFKALELEKSLVTQLDNGLTYVSDYAAIAPAAPLICERSPFGIQSSISGTFGGEIARARGAAGYRALAAGSCSMTRLVHSAFAGNNAPSGSPDT